MTQPQLLEGLRTKIARIGWSNHDFLVGGAGYFSFLIHEDELQRLDFGRVYPRLEDS